MCNDQAAKENHCMSANVRNGFAVKIGRLEGELGFAGITCAVRERELDCNPG